MIRAALILVIGILFSTQIISQSIHKEFIDPPREFSVMPFWFWNDTLKAEEIVRQIDDFEKHGVYGFVIHPRIGLPSDMRFLSDEMLGYMKLAIEEAELRDMKVILYDEGMYPSGSAEGQVVARNPKHAARGLMFLQLDEGEKLKLKDDWNLVSKGKTANGKDYAVIERPTNGHIRGLFWEDEEKGKENLPPAGDILNPDAVTSFIELVYDKFYDNFNEHFNKTVLAVFTDEPDPVGRGKLRGIKAGNAKLLPRINEIIGYDFTPFLPDLWIENSSDFEKHREDYERAITICLEESYYGRLSKWCEEHGIALTGHPAKSMDLGAQKYFHIPGQDLVWRYVVQDKTALEGEHSTMAKNASSAMVHLNRRRNSNELYGAYGHELTHDEMVWLANWCFVRGQNLLYPHAFYYSVRGARFNERPPDVGPNAKWWGSYKEYADACRRLSWLNTDSKQVCEIAVIGDANWLPDQSTKVLFQNQFDFNYLDMAHLGVKAIADKEGMHIAGMNYKIVILDGGLKNLTDNAIPVLKDLAQNGRLIIYEDSPLVTKFPEAKIAKSPKRFVETIKKLVEPDIVLSPASKGIRYRHVVKENAHYYIIFNEGETVVETKIDIAIKGKSWWLNEVDAKATPATLNKTISFQPHELKVLMMED